MSRILFNKKRESSFVFDRIPSKLFELEIMVNKESHIQSKGWRKVCTEFKDRIPAIQERINIKLQ